jgi:hypothetical protein
MFVKVSLELPVFFVLFFIFGVTSNIIFFVFYYKEHEIIRLVFPILSIIFFVLSCLLEVDWEYIRNTQQGGLNWWSILWVLMVYVLGFILCVNFFNIKEVFGEKLLKQ